MKGNLGIPLIVVPGKLAGEIERREKLGILRDIPTKRTGSGKLQPLEWAWEDPTGICRHREAPNPGISERNAHGGLGIPGNSWDFPFPDGQSRSRSFRAGAFPGILWRNPARNLGISELQNPPGRQEFPLGILLAEREILGIFPWRIPRPGFLIGAEIGISGSQKAAGILFPGFPGELFPAGIPRGNPDPGFFRNLGLSKPFGFGG